MDNRAIGEAKNKLEDRFAQLLALTTLIHGNGHAAFSCLAGADQDNILWLVHSLASECRRLVGTVVWDETGDSHD